MACPTRSTATLAAVLATTTALAGAARADAGACPDGGASCRTNQLRGVAEIGFLGVLDHDVQFGRQGTRLDYDDQAGQDTLYAVTRFSVEGAFGPRHRVILLYQPLSLRTQVPIAEDLRIHDLTFPAGTPVVFTYDFPFYRASWLYDLDARPEDELALGLSFQIRNATIAFESLDGTLLRSERDVGPVPILKARARHDLGCGRWIGAEVDGLYAPVSYLNGDDNEVVGAILDASLRAGLRIDRGAELFVNLRYLGGGASGQGDPEPPGDGYVRNWLHFVTVTVGLTTPAL